MRQIRRSIGFVRTTAIGGLLFLLPLIVLGALIGQAVPIVLAIANGLGGMLPGFLKTAGGVSLLIVLSVGILLLLCFAAGLIARWSYGRAFREAFEKKLLFLFPRYAILKDQMADSIGGELAKAEMKPVMVRFDDYQRVGFETERNPVRGLVAVYLPGSPDTWGGKVVLVEESRIEPLAGDFGETIATCEQLGRGSTLLKAVGAS